MKRSAALALLPLFLPFFSTPALGQSSDTAVALAWRIPAGVRFTLELSDSLSSDSTSATTSRNQIRARTRFDVLGEAPGPDGMHLRVYRRAWYSVSLDRGQSWSPEQEGGPVDSVLLLMTPRGHLEPLEQGAHLSAGAVIEELAGGLPFTLPLLPVRPGDTWPVAQSGIRKNRMFGEMQFDRQGEARLDSVVGDRAYLSLRASSRDQTDRMAILDSTAARVVWDIRAGRPVMVQQRSLAAWTKGAAAGTGAMTTNSSMRQIQTEPATTSTPNP